MTRRNRYANPARISSKKFRQLLQYFVLDLNGPLDQVESEYSEPKHEWRERIAQFCETQSSVGGEVEADESYLGARRIKGKRGLVAYGNTIVFCLVQCNGQVFSELVPGPRKATLQVIICGEVTLDSVIYSDGRPGYIVC